MYFGSQCVVRSSLQCWSEQLYLFRDDLSLRGRKGRGRKGRGRRGRERKRERSEKRERERRERRERERERRLCNKVWSRQNVANI